MRRKSKHRKVCAINPDALGWVLKGLKPLARVQDEGANVLTKISLRNHSALEALRQGHGDHFHIDKLVGAANMAVALVARYNRGSDFADEISLFRDAVFTAFERGCANGSFYLTDPETAAVTFALQVHDAQLDITTVGELEDAIDYVTNRRCNPLGLRVAPRSLYGFPDP